MKHRLVTVLLVVCAFLGSVLALGKMDITMMPSMDSDEVVINIEMPLGTRYEETKAPVSIMRETQIRTMHITAGVKDGYSVRNTQGKIQGLLNEEGIDFSFAGSFIRKSGLILRSSAPAHTTVTI